MSPEARYDVFICYRSEDQKAVRILFDELTERDLNPYWDQLLEPGDDWLTVLAQQLETCRPFILCLGSGGLSFEQEGELRLALTGSRHRFFPVLLPGGVIPEDNFLWHRVRSNQFVDLRDGMDQPEVLERLAEQIRQNQADPLEEEPGEPIPEEDPESSVATATPFIDVPPLQGGMVSIPPRPSPALLRRRRALLVGFAVFLDLVVIAVVFLNYQRKGVDLEEQKKILTSRTLASDALQIKDRRRDEAIQLSLEAYQVAPTIEARGNLLTLLQESSHLKLFLPGDQRRDRSWAVFSPTGDRIFSAEGKFLYLWKLVKQPGEAADAPPGVNAELESSIDLGSESPIVSLAVSPDGNRLALSKAHENGIRLYSAAGVPLKPIDAPAGADNLTFSPKKDSGLLAYSVTQQIFLRDVGGQEAQPPLTFSQHTDFVSKLAFSPDGKTLASAGVDQAVYLWKVPGKGKEAWRAPDGKALGKLTKEDGGFNAVAFSPDGSLLAIAGKSIQLWDVQNSQLQGTLLHDGSLKEPVLAVAFSPNGKFLASAGTDRRIRLWALPKTKADDAKLSSHLVGHGGAIWSLSFDNDGTLLSSGNGGEAILWDLDSPPSLARALAGQFGSSRSLALSSDASFLALAGEEGRITLYDAAQGKLFKHLASKYRSAINHLAFDQAGHILTAGDEEGRLLVWRDGVFDRETEYLKQGDKNPILGLAVSPDGTRVAVAATGKRIVVWNVEGKEDPSPLPTSGEDNEFSELAFDPSGLKLATAGDRQLTVWDIRKNKPISGRKEAHDERITRLAFHPGGQVLASGGLDGTIRLWRVEPGSAELQPLGRAIPVSPTTALAWSGDGMVLAAGDGDGTIALLDTQEERLIGSGLKSTDRISGLAFRRDGQLISLSGAQLLGWDLQYETWRSYACSLLGRSLLLQEWTKYLEGKPHPICPETSPKNL